MKNHMTLIIGCATGSEAFARSAVAAFCACLDPTVDQISDIKTAVSEAVTNCMVHAYEGGDGDIRIDVELSDGTVHIAVTDSGIGIKDIEKAREPFYTTKADDERSGMGFTVMESFMDSLEVQNNPPHGLVVKMSKAINKEQA